MSQADSMRERVLAAAAATPAPTRTEARRRVTALLVTAAAFALAWFESIGGVGHADGRPRTLTVAIAGGWALWCGALTWMVLGRRSTMGRPPAVVLGAAIATPLALLVWMSVFDGTFVEPFARFGWRCMGHTIVMGALPLVAMLVARRGAEPRAPAALGAAVGAIAGAWAGVLVDLWCPLTNAPHVLVGHVAPLLMLVAVGALAGARVLGVRRR